MTIKAVEIYGEGCLDIALGYYLVMYSSEHKTRITHTAPRRGWQNTIKFMMRRLEQVANGDGISPSRIIIFIDADNSLTDRLNEIKRILKNSKISSLIEIREVYSHFEQSQEDLPYPPGLELSLKDRRDVNVLIILWAIKKDDNTLSGTVEDVIRMMLSEAYGCPVAIHSNKLGDIAGCSHCPNKVPKMISVIEKLTPIILLASCAGTGTLVSVHGIDSIDAASSYCGLPVLDTLERLDKLKSTSVFQRYSLLIREFLSRE